MRSSFSPHALWDSPTCQDTFDQPRPEPMPSSDQAMTLRLLGNFELTKGGRLVTVGHNSQRLIALLAVKGRALERPAASILLWPDALPDKASTNLRNTIWRLGHNCPGVIETSRARIGLAHVVQVDIQDFVRYAWTVLTPMAAGDVVTLPTAIRHYLHKDLLPKWDADWLSLERLRIRQLQFGVSDWLCDQLVSAKAYDAAIVLALAVLERNPHRESTHRLLIRAYAASGDHRRAQDRFAIYREIVSAELGLT
jgi:DNA-binding SARP family transcriptional activator